MYSVRVHRTPDHLNDGDQTKLFLEPYSQPLCCRKVSNGVKNSEKSHYWGTRRSCDIPFRTFEATMEAAKSTLPNPDLIFWTGDAPAHDIWAYSKGLVSKSLIGLNFWPMRPVWIQFQEKTNFFVKNVTDYFLQYYPNSIILPARDSRTSQRPMMSIFFRMSR